MGLAADVPSGLNSEMLLLPLLATQTWAPTAAMPLDPLSPLPESTGNVVTLVAARAGATLPVARSAAAPSKLATSVVITRAESAVRRPRFIVSPPAHIPQYSLIPAMY